MSNRIESGKVLLARHGQSFANLERWVSGWSQVDLTAKGEEAAREMGRRMKASGLEIAGILASDLCRARRTAELANESLGLEIIFDSRLRERNYGDWTGVSYDDVGFDGYLFEKLPHEDHIRPPGGESLVEQRERAKAALDEGISRWKGRLFLVVSHRGTLRTLLQGVHGVEYAQTPVPLDPPGWMEVDWKIK